MSPGEEYAAKYGLKYWVKSSSDINWKLQRNIIFLEDYWLDADYQVLPEVSEVIREAVKKEPGILLINLLSLENVQPDDVYYMLARWEFT